MSSVGIFLVFSMKPIFAVDESKTEAQKISNCKKGSHFFKQGEGKFTLMLSCEDALGSFAAVLYTGVMGGPSDHGWKIDNRYWHQEQWSDSPTSFIWISNDKLAIATSESSGKSAVYLLDLLNKKSMILAEPRNGNSVLKYLIESFSPKSSMLDLTEIDFEMKERKISVPL